MYGNEGGYGQRRSYAPVQVGDELEVTIEAVGEKGDGIAKKDGFVLFVPNTKQGDKVTVKVSRVLRKVGFAEVVGEGQTSSRAEEEAGEAPEEEAPLEDTEDFGEEVEAEPEESGEEEMEEDR